MSTDNVVNPGLVNVADQAQAPVSVDQAVTVSPSSDAGPTVQAGSPAPGEGVANAASTVTPPMTAGTTVQGGTFSPEGPNVDDVTANTVVEQQYGQGSPTDVYV